MTKTITATRRGRHANHRHSNNRISHDVERIIKKAMLQTTAHGLRRKLKNFISGSLENAKDKTETIHENVANYAYKKPIRTLGIALLTGAAIALIVNKSLENHRPRRRLFG